MAFVETVTQTASEVCACPANPLQAKRDADFTQTAREVTVAVVTVVTVVAVVAVVNAARVEPEPPEATATIVPA